MLSAVSSFGGKAVSYRPDEIYPQLLQVEDAEADKEWREMTDIMREQLIKSGMFTKEGKKITK